MDHPSGDGPNTYVVSKVTKEAGITMALSGLGSDEIFAGYPVFTRSLSLWEQRWLMGIPRPLRSLAASALLRVKRSPASYKIADLLRLSSVAVEYTYPISRLGFTDRKLAAIITGDPLPPNEVRTIMHALMHEQGGASLPLLSQVSLAEISTYMQNILLRDTDQMSMAHALEVRVPFLDHELVEFVMGVSDEQKFPHTPKKLLVDSLGDLLPPEIVHRPKMGFTLPWSQWMRTALRSYCASRMDVLAKHSAFRAEGVHALWQSFINGDKGVSWAHVWHLVVLADWMERNGIE